MIEKNERSWRCAVCGFVYRGPEPPEYCPVCGAGATDFEPHVEETPAKVDMGVSQWRCLNCAYVHTGSEPPSECPVCAALKDRFEPIQEEGAATGRAASKEHLVVIGAGIAGLSAVEAYRKYAPEGQITLLAKEEELPYYRLNLTRYLAGEISEETLPVYSRDWFSEHKIDLLLGAEAAELQLPEKSVRLRNDNQISFDKLALTIGSHAFVPPVPGTRREGVTVLRTLHDAKRILSSLEPGVQCVCIGGGLLGLETAGALVQRGADVTLLEGHGWLIPRQLNQKAGDYLQRYVEAKGIHLRRNALVKEIPGDERAAGVLLEDGTSLSASLIIIAVGVRPNSHLARRAGLEVNKGVVVDNYLTTSHPDVLAAGDVSEHRGVLYGNWSASQSQGNIVGMNAAGQHAEFGGIPRSNTLKVLGADLLSIGQFEPEDASYLALDSEQDGIYYRFVFRDGCMVGAVLLGDTSVSGAVKKAIETKRDFSGTLRTNPSAYDIVRELS